MTPAQQQEHLREWVAKEIQRHGPGLARFVLQGHGPHARGVVAQALLSDYMPEPEPEKKGGKKGKEQAPPSPPTTLEIDREISNSLFPRAVAEAKTIRRGGVAGPYRFSVLSYTVDDAVSERWPLLIELPDDGTEFAPDHSPTGINAELMRLVKESHDQLLDGYEKVTLAADSVIKALTKENDALRGREHEGRELWFEYSKKTMSLELETDAKRSKDKRTEDMFKAAKAAFDKFLTIAELKARVESGVKAPQTPQEGPPALPAPIDIAGAPGEPTGASNGTVEGEPPDLSKVSPEQLAKAFVQMTQIVDRQNKTLAAMQAKLSELDQLAAFVRGAMGKD